MTLSKSNKKLKLFLYANFIIFILIHTINLISLTKTTLSFNQNDFFYFIVLYLLAFSYSLILPIGIRGTITIELGNIILLTSLTNINFHYTLIAANLGYLLALYLKHVSYEKILYNISNLTISLSLANYLIKDLNSYNYSNYIFILKTYSLYIILTIISILSFTILIFSINDKKIKIKEIYLIYKQDFLYLMYIVLFFITPLAIITNLIYQQNKFTILLILMLIYIISKITSDIKEMTKHTSKAIESLVSVLEANDIYTAGHSNRVAHYAKEIAKSMNLPEKEIKTIFNAGKIHDIGKIYIDDAVLKKRGKLSKEEFQQMKYHPKIFDIILKDLTQLKDEINIAKYHHERWDGKGYPYRLKGKQIPLGARILSVADAFDALTSGRPYKNWMDENVVFDIIIKDAGTRYDPEVIEAFKKTFHTKSFQYLIKKYKAAEAKRRNALLKNYKNLLTKMLTQSTSTKK